MISQYSSRRNCLDRVHDVGLCRNLPQPLHQKCILTGIATTAILSRQAGIHTFLISGDRVPDLVHRKKLVMLVYEQLPESLTCNVHGRCCMNLVFYLYRFVRVSKFELIISLVVDLQVILCFSKEGKEKSSQSTTPWKNEEACWKSKGSTQSPKCNIFFSRVIIYHVSCHGMLPRHASVGGVTCIFRQL